MHPEKMQAIVLSSSDYGDSDRIVALFTLGHGLVKGFARGARNSRKRFGPALETFARVETQLVHRDGLSSVRSADLITLYPGIRGKLSSIARALYACELVEVLVPEGQPLPRLYRLLTAYLERLDSGITEDGDRHMYEVNLLNILGYRPSLEACCRCGAKFFESGALLQPGGELLCRFCTVSGHTIPPEALRWLARCLATGHFGNAAATCETVQAAAVLLDESLICHTTRKLKSLDFLQHACNICEP